MLIGILSDTHDRANAMAAAIQLLQEHRAEYFIHCGDVGGEAVLDHLAGLPAAFVWGNNDWDRKSLEAYAEGLGIKCLGAEGELELGGKRFVVMHGDDFAAKQRVLAGQSCDYLLEGHTHVRRDERIGKVRCINPGALYRAREKTAALLDTETDRLTFLQVPGI
jgi:putative phosphoesterase